MFLCHLCLSLHCIDYLNYFRLDEARRLLPESKVQRMPVAFVAPMPRAAFHWLETRFVNRLPGRLSSTVYKQTKEAICVFFLLRNGAALGRIQQQRTFERRRHRCLPPSWIDPSVAAAAGARPLVIYHASEKQEQMAGCILGEVKRGK